jgi:hypothetical protein
MYTQILAYNLKTTVTHSLLTCKNGDVFYIGVQKNIPLSEVISFVIIRLRSLSSPIVIGEFRRSLTHSHIGNGFITCLLKKFRPNYKLRIKKDSQTMGWRDIYDVDDDNDDNGDSNSNNNTFKINFKKNANKLPSYVRFEIFTAVAMKNGVFWDIKTQFVLHRKHITSPLQSPAG